MYSAGAYTFRDGIYSRVGIYFPGGHVHLFAMIKTKIPGPSIYSPGACTRREGVYFPCRHLLSSPACALIWHEKKIKCLPSSGKHLLSV